MDKKKRLIAAATILIAVLAALGVWFASTTPTAPAPTTVTAAASTDPSDPVPAPRGAKGDGGSSDDRFKSTAGPGSMDPGTTNALNVPDGDVRAKKAVAGWPAPYRISEVDVPPRSSLGRTLQNLGLSAGTVARLSSDIKATFNLAKVAAGTPVTVAWKDAGLSEPMRVELKLNETRTLVAHSLPVTGGGDEAPRWAAEFRDEEVTRRTVAFAGVVTSNLWSSAAMAGMDSQVIQKLAEVFAWQIDFNREVQVNDRWRLSVEQLFVKGRSIGFGEIVAAEYENVGAVSSAVRFKWDGVEQYYAPDGHSLRRMFLKSPLKFGHITSGFALKRFHPILKINRPHNGIDYGAPIGTPIMAVGSGTVLEAGMHGGSGNMVALRHSAIYETQYKHMSRFAAGIRRGAHVEMGQIIGYVGQTGLATGPHLHYEFHDHGRYVNPQGLKFPAADPVPSGAMPRYQAQVATMLAELPPWSEAVLTHKRDERDSASRHE